MWQITDDRWDDDECERDQILVRQICLILNILYNFIT